MKDNKGITLIALVITIIVLLILAGITIAMLTGQNGLLTKANQAKVTDLEASATEKVRLAVAAMNLELQQKKVTNSSYNPVGDSDMLSALTGDLTPAADWDLPDAIAATTQVTYENSDYKAAHNNQGLTFTIYVTSTGISFNS